jgi:acyl homoserine lactone synthase
MAGISNDSTAIFFEDQASDARAAEIRRFRKRIFVEDKGWKLRVSGEEERDDYDACGAILCGLWQDQRLTGSFRAQRCDRPYLSAEVFPHLADNQPLPDASDAWEISRFAAAPNRSDAGVQLYALLMAFAQARSARCLIAVADMQHERLMRRLGIVTRRYGESKQVGLDRCQKPIFAVLGEIPIASQPAEVLEKLAQSLQKVEIIDETLVFGHFALSA